MKPNKGITLVALVMTIIVLLILAGVVINITIGNEGIIRKAQSAVDMYKNAQGKEEIEIAKMANEIDNYINNTRDNDNCVTILVNGAPNEIIAFSSSINIKLNKYGTNLLNIEKGSYNVSGSISKYEKNIVITDNTKEINVYPDGAIYWYGKKLKPYTIDMSGSGSGVEHFVSENDTCIYCYSHAVKNISHSACLISTNVNVSNCSKAYVKYDYSYEGSFSNRNLEGAYLSTNLGESPETIFADSRRCTTNTKSGTFELDISNTNIQKITINNVAGDGTGTAELNIQAFWIE